MGAACGGRVRVCDVIPQHLDALLSAFCKMGLDVECDAHSVCVNAQDGYRNIVLETAPYPGFATDLHPQMVALFANGARASGVGVMRERIWASRFRYVEGLRAMGANICVQGDSATVLPKLLHRASVRCPDLRGGAALLIAALSANGESEINSAASISRGYEHFGEKLSALGARVKIK
jgi:UDP-N-acetylglucosamine 1-carboxyvinyltransferase